MAPNKQKATSREQGILQLTVNGFKDKRVGLPNHNKKQTNNDSIKTGKTSSVVILAQAGEGINADFYDQRRQFTTRRFTRDVDLVPFIFNITMAPKQKLRNVSLKTTEKQAMTKPG